MVEACCITHEIDSKLLRSISITYLGLFGEKKNLETQDTQETQERHVK